MDQKQLSTGVLWLGWALSVATCAYSFVAWAGDVRWQFNGLTAYLLFPLPGLIAFNLMWVHYVVTALRRKYHLEHVAFGTYYTITGWIVLLALVVHPGLLIWQLWRDGFGLPPGSFLEHFVAPQLGWVALLGTVSLLVFLAFELHRWYGKRPWWRLVNWANELAMVAIFYHGLRLGTDLRAGFFPVVWLAYGVGLISLLLYLHAAAYSNETEPATWRTAHLVMIVIIAVSGIVAIANGFGLG